MKRHLLISLTFLLISCGGGSDGGTGGGAGGGDTTAPTGYSVGSLTNPVDIDSETNVSFSLSGAEVGASYRYTFTDEQNAQVSGTGEVSTAEQVIDGIDISELVDGTIRLQLTLTDSSNNIGSVVESTTTKDAQPEITSIRISGQVTFDRVPHNMNGIGLDYDSISELPIREISLRIRDASNDTIATTKTDANGDYQVTVPANIEVRVEVLAELFEADPGLNWLTRVVDDSSGNALYVLQGSLADTGEADQIRNLHAGSGWDGTDYTAERAAAPFAILDSLYQIYDRIRSESVSLSMPELEVRWSGGNADGSFYRSGGGADYIEIGGAANLDTDEYDQHVIVHEWLHYYEDQVSRGDTIGGSHSLSDHLEPRTAYSEGRGNAWSGIILDDPIYKDALGAGQELGFDLNLESETGFVSGWYSERSVQEIIYDLVDSDNEGVDTLNLSVADLIDVWQSSDYVNQNSLTTLYSFREVLEDFYPPSATAITALMQNEDILGTGLYGAGETNDGGQTYGLPVYHDLSVGAVPFEICSDRDEGEYNRLGNRQLLRFSIHTEGSYLVEMDRHAGSTNYDAAVETDPDFVIYLQDSAVTNYDGGQGSSPDVDNETLTTTFAVGDYVMEAFDWFNTDDDNATGGLSCFDISILSN